MKPLALGLILGLLIFCDTGRAQEVPATTDISPSQCANDLIKSIADNYLASHEITLTVKDLEERALTLKNSGLFNSGLIDQAMLHQDQFKEIFASPVYSRALAEALASMFPGIKGRKELLDQFDVIVGFAGDTEQKVNFAGRVYKWFSYYLGKTDSASILELPLRRRAELAGMSLEEFEMNATIWSSYLAGNDEAFETAVVLNLFVQRQDGQLRSSVERELRKFIIGRVDPRKFTDSRKWRWGARRYIIPEQHLESEAEKLLKWQRGVDRFIKDSDATHYRSYIADVVEEAPQFVSGKELFESYEKLANHFVATRGLSTYLNDHDSKIFEAFRIQAIEHLNREEAIKIRSIFVGFAEQVQSYYYDSQSGLDPALSNFLSGLNALKNNLNLPWYRE